MHDTDRRRILLAALVTLVAVPAFVLYDRGGDDPNTEQGGSGAAAAPLVAETDAGNVINPLPGQSEATGRAEVINPLPGQTDQTPIDTDVVPASNESNLPPPAPLDDSPIFMNGPVANAEDEIADVAIPAQPAIPPLMIDATYLSTVPGTRTCLVRGVESGRTVTVTNLDNGRSITCVTALAPRVQRDELVMHTESFSQLADLTEAPIAVEVRQ